MEYKECQCPPGTAPAQTPLAPEAVDIAAATSCQDNVAGHDAHGQDTQAVSNVLLIDARLAEPEGRHIKTPLHESSHNLLHDLELMIGSPCQEWVKRLNPE